MRRTKRVAMLGLLLLVAAAPAAAMTVEEVIAKHIEAKGGRAAWEAIRSMKLTGRYTAFSNVAPFTLHRARDHRFHIDHVLDGKPVVIGHDGKTAWWDNAWIQEGARPVSGPDLEVVDRQADFTTPFFDYAERGFTVELLGPSDFEGVPVLGVKLVRGEGSEETWYLDPETYLEVGRMSPGSDFGNPMPQRTYYEDFREVSGVLLPHLIEAQWYTRNRLMEVEQVEINLPIEDELFRMPAPTGMGPLLPMVGKWKVKLQQRNQPGAPWQDSERDSSVEATLRGALIREKFTNSGGNEAIWTLSYDRYREKYRMTQIDDASTYLDVKEGDFDDDGRLVLSNVETGTSLHTFGMVIFGRTSLFDIGEDGFKMEFEASIDNGENWFLAAKASFTPAE